MIKVELFDKYGQKLTEINVKAESIENVNCVSWGSGLFVSNFKNNNRFEQIEVFPAVIKSKKNN